MRGRMPRLRKRVIVGAVLLVTLLSAKLAANGPWGLVADVQKLALLVLMWVAVWHVFLKDRPLFRNLWAVLSQVTEEERTQPEAARRGRVQYADE